MTIAVTGGNGEFGRAVVESLTARTTEPVLATVRDLAKIRPLDGVEHRPGDFADPDTLRNSLDGADTVLINATFFGADPSQRLPLASAAIAAAAEAGLARIVLTSWSDLDRATHVSVRDYRELEQQVKRAGPAWTILRLSCGLADAVARDVTWARRGGELVAPAADGRVTPAAVTDLAEATAAVLSSPDNDQSVLEVTGPDAISWQDLAQLAGVPYRPVTDDDYRTYLQKFDMPAPAADQLVALYADMRSDWASTPTPVLETLLGHPAVPGIDAVARRLRN
ncbi:NAD(P)H-binding protein [Actinoplanes sp. NPDC051513]|uniref:NAD(P)H-binding protein n=1 Tax=Actinoplanes sp. NPDC051513 TaxID=3363908 RepID=UPI00378B7699